VWFFGLNSHPSGYSESHSKFPLRIYHSLFSVYMISLGSIPCPTCRLILNKCMYSTCRTQRLTLKWECKLHFITAGNPRASSVTSRIKNLSFLLDFRLGRRKAQKLEHQCSEGKSFPRKKGVDIEKTQETEGEKPNPRNCPGLGSMLCLRQSYCELLSCELITHITPPTHIFFL
jgi:hypothetical protein